MLHLLRMRRLTTTRSNKMSLNEHYVNTETTEKVMKGFVYGMPMFVNGRQGITNDCERLGFDMFRDYMVNDYDAELIQSKRIDMMLDCAEVSNQLHQFTTAL